MTNVKLTALTLLLSLGPLDKCMKKDAPDAEAPDAAPATSATAVTNDTTEEVVVDAGAGKPPVRVPAKPKDAGVGDGGKDGGVADAAVAIVDAGKGTLPPKLTIKQATEFDSAALESKIKARDPLVVACYLATGKEPAWWANRCYDLGYDANGLVTTVEGKSLDALGKCVKTAFVGLQFGAPKNKMPGHVAICQNSK